MLRKLDYVRTDRWTEATARLGSIDTWRGWEID
jgi:hypothetical protein